LVKKIEGILGIKVGVALGVICQGLVCLSYNLLCKSYVPQNKTKFYLFLILILAFTDHEIKLTNRYYSVHQFEELVWPQMEYRNQYEAANESSNTTSTNHEWFQ
jgi:hypothetical protein